VVLQARRGQGQRELQQCYDRMQDVQRQLAVQQVGTACKSVATGLYVHAWRLQTGFSLPDEVVWPKTAGVLGNAPLAVFTNKAAA